MKKGRTILRYEAPYHVPSTMQGILHFLTQSSQHPCQRCFIVLPISQIKKWRPQKWSDLPKGTSLVIVGIRAIHLFNGLLMPDPELRAEDSGRGTHSLSLWGLTSVWDCLI